MRRPCGSEKAMEGFERITGFREEPYERTRSRPSVSTDGCGLASLALEAAYEATSWPQRSTDRVSETETVYLTRRGGGAFGNDADGIHAAMRSALERCRDSALDVRLVSYSGVPGKLRTLAQAFSE